MIPVIPAIPVAILELEQKVAGLRPPHPQTLATNPANAGEFVEVLDALAEAYIDVDAAKSLALSQEAYDAAVAQDHIAVQAASLWKVGWLSARYGQTALGLTKLAAAQNLAQRAGDLTLETRIAYHLGAVHSTAGNYVEALQCRLQALAGARQLGHRELEADCLDAIGVECAEIGHDQQALYNYAAALEIYRELHSAREGYVLAHIADVCINLQDYPQALHYGELARDAVRHTGPKQRNATAAQHLYEATILRVLGRVHLNMGHGPKAAQYFERALKIYEGDPRAQADAQASAQASAPSDVHNTVPVARPYAQDYLVVRMEMGKVHRLLNAHDTAEQVWTETLNMAQHNAARPVVMHLHQLLYQLHRDAGRDEAALQHHEAWLALHQHIFNVETERRIKLLQVNHQTAEVQREAAALRMKTTELEQIVHTRTSALERSQIEMLERLAAAVEARDVQTGDHIKRVGLLASALAQEMGLDDETVDMIRLAAPLHDIGKISIPDHILLKQDGLSEPEAQIMRDHTLTGARMLSQGTSKLIRMAETIALSHHEFWDGTGYPHHLAGEQIPLPGRIVAVADAFDAMLSERPYKLAYSMRRALEEIRRCAGSQFDPHVVAALERWAAAHPQGIS